MPRFQRHFRHTFKICLSTIDCDSLPKFPPLSTHTVFIKAFEHLKINKSTQTNHTKISAQQNFDDIFQYLSKSIEIGLKWDQSHPLFGHLERNIKICVSSSFFSLFSAWNSIWPPTERHILIARAITNEDFSACLVTFSSHWKMVLGIWKKNKRHFWDRL